ncbi:hypothetical protein D3C80_1962060 [compost metagenome]
MPFFIVSSDTNHRSLSYAGEVFVITEHSFDIFIPEDTPGICSLIIDDRIIFQMALVPFKWVKLFDSGSKLSDFSYRN